MNVKRKIAVGTIALMAANFKDVPASHWGYGAIQWAANNGIVVGYGDGTFRPDRQVSEAEFLTMLINAYHPTLPNVEKRHWADPYYAFSRQMNYPLEGYDDVSKRSWVINRTRVAEIVAGAAGYNYTGRDAIHFLLDRGLARGKDPSQLSIEGYHGEDLLTRAEAVQFVKNVLESGLKELKVRPKEPSDPKLLPPLPGQQQPQPSPQPQPQPQPQPGGSGIPTVGTWTPCDSTVLGKAFFSSFKINGDGTVTVRIPTLAELGPNAVWTGGSYIPPDGSGMMAFNLNPGETRTLKMGLGATISTSLLTTASKGGMEGYTVFLDGSWKVGASKRVNGQAKAELTTLDAVLKGLGLK